MIILFREDLDSENELATAQQYMPLVRYRTEVPNLETVIGRYSVLPFYKELEAELATKGSRLINSHTEHKYIANLLNWSESELAGLTPKTYDNWYKLPEGSYVLKGQTNSRKHQWLTHMFAPTLADIPNIAKNLMNDTMINEQGIIVREYIPLKQLDTGINGLPITNEWRFFYLVVDGVAREIAHGFYWASEPELITSAVLAPEGIDLANKAAQKLATKCSFFAIDIAETLAGPWTVIEVNDGQMSGLACISADEFYAKLRVLTNE